MMRKNEGKEPKKKSGTAIKVAVGKLSADLDSKSNKVRGKSGKESYYLTLLQ